MCAASRRLKVKPKMNFMEFTNKLCANKSVCVCSLVIIRKWCHTQTHLWSRRLFMMTIKYAQLAKYKPNKNQNWNYGQIEEENADKEEYWSEKILSFDHQQLAWNKNLKTAAKLRLPFCFLHIISLRFILYVDWYTFLGRPPKHTNKSVRAHSTRRQRYITFRI